MTEIRHVLVIAPQCPALGALKGLETVAESLYEAVTNPWLGGCEKGPLTSPSLLSGGSVTQAGVEQAIREAADRAGKAGATLVLALIGHGTVSGGRLYFMAGSSTAGDIHTGVDVGALLLQTLEAPGLNGVIAIVDTCHAAGAIPDLNSLSLGDQGGRTRLSILMSSAIREDSYELRFTRGIVKVLTEGISGAGEYLEPSAVADVVRTDAEIAGQTPVRVELDGDPFAERRLWLARNRRNQGCVSSAGSLLGPVAIEELDRALEPLGRAGTAITCVGDMEALRREIADRADPLSADRALALRVLDVLQEAPRTIALLNSWPGTALTSGRLRRALSAGFFRSGESLPITSGSELVRDAVEFLLLRAPGIGQSRTACLAAFVAALALDTDIDQSTPVLTRWAQEIGAAIELNDAFEELRKRDPKRRARLVVSLHSAVGDEWPESLEAWLLAGDGRRCPHEAFPCEPSRKGVERKLGAVLKWATQQAQELGTPLHQVEVAASAALLVEWRPEETNVGLRMGARYDVVLRWSDRIHPPPDLWWINDVARERLIAMDTPCASGAPVDWLSEEDTRHVPGLGERLENGEFDRAVAVSHRPARLKELITSLLPYSPIVMWPGGQSQLPAETRHSLDTYWQSLPAEFCRAYRDSWKQNCPERPGAQLAQLRTIWHDLEWLEFCSWFEQFTTEGEIPA
ncbi:hypothetical protein GCM10020367_54980 [Streptomyces sannanensis]|uniref:vWA-MoxR associated protein middle region 2 domain-containing protein n=1 Tax=Streptomyces sannanensis TaxID=285536 RepID=A0ABP6SJ93_9ACTN